MPADQKGTVMYLIEKTRACEKRQEGSCGKQPKKQCGETMVGKHCLDREQIDQPHGNLGRIMMTLCLTVSGGMEWLTAAAPIVN